MSLRLVSLSILLIALLSASPLLAQQTGSVSGTVVDPQGSLKSGQ